MSTIEAVYQELENIFRAVTDPYPRDLTRVHHLLDRLGRPDAAYPSIIVTGSKGKGSTATFLAALLEKSRQPPVVSSQKLPNLHPSSFILHPSSLIGLFTGPHLHTYRERIKLNGVDIGIEEFIGLFEEVQAAIKSDPAGGYVSRFEIITAMALLHFARAGVDLAVLEVGQGGRYDAVNVAYNSPLAVFTPIEMEHVRVLGPTQADIVHHKAGIMRAGKQAITSRQTPEVEDMLKAAAAELEVTLKQTGEFWRYTPRTLKLHLENGRLWQEFEATGPADQKYRLRTGLAGTFQIENTFTALAATQMLAEMGLSGQPELSALQNAAIPGRLEVAGQDPLVLLDGAHTPNAVRELVRTLENFSGTPVWVLAFLKEKNIEEMLRLLPVEGRPLILTELHSHLKRRATTGEAKAAFEQIKAPVIEEPDLGRAIATARQVAAEIPGGYVCITGSLYLVAEARVHLGLLDPATAAEADLIRRIEQA
jgi:dihydrofolate synthase/folylpolyglutamate synthase